MYRRQTLSVVGLCVLLVWAPGVVRGGHLTFFDVASSEDGWLGFGTEPSINDFQEVGFISRKSGEALGVYVGSSRGNELKLADLDEEVDGLRFSGFTSDALVSNDRSVSFLATLDSGEMGIYRATAGAVTTLVDNDDESLGFSFFQNPSVNSFGEVSFLGTANGVTGVYVVGPGGGVGFVENTDGPRTSFGPPVITDDRLVTYTAFRDTGGQGVFLAVPGLILPLVTADEGFLGFADPDVNRNHAAYLAVDDTNDFFIEVANFAHSEIIAHEDDGFSSLGQPALTWYGEVVYEGAGAFGSRGIYYDLGTGLGGGLLIGTGSELFGSTVTGLDFEADGVSKLGFVAFGYALEDGRFGIASVALPLPLYNGGFEQGGGGPGGGGVGGGGGGGGDQEEIPGWEVWGFDSDGELVETPHVTTETSGGGNTFLRLKTGPYADGVLRSTISQSFLVHEGEALFSFNLTEPVFEADATGAGSSDPGGLNTNELHDRVEVSLEAGGERYLLLVMGVEGVEVGPFDPVFPGALSATGSADAGFDLTFSADLSAFVGMPVAVLIDVINEDDFLLLDPDFDGFALTAGLVVVPEPGSVVVMGLAWVGLVGRGVSGRRGE